jgi:hypothetical protein
LEPYWGQPCGILGNRRIIRSPIRPIVLPDTKGNDQHENGESSSGTANTLKSALEAAETQLEKSVADFVIAPPTIDIGGWSEVEG